MHHDYHDRSRLIAKIVRSSLATETFETLADLTDAVKFRCARLRIGWTPEDIQRGLALVASNTTLTASRPHRAQRQRTEQQVDALPVSQADAAAILQRLGVQL